MARLEMNYLGFFVDERWPWEEAGRVQFCPMDDCARSVEDQVLEALRSVATEFQLPLHVETASENTCELIRNLFADATTSGALRCERLLKSLNDKRTGEPQLRAALLVGFSGKDRELQDCGFGKPNEPPEWGWTAQDGLILLRMMPEQPLRNVVRHEMGHLLGIDEHHSGCLMDWSCTEESFCNKCRDGVLGICQTA